MQPTKSFIVHGIHITENLKHHKTSDVRRILEEKGFKEGTAGADSEATHFYPATGEEQSGKQTTIQFGQGDFVLEEGGVSHSE